MNKLTDTKARLAGCTEPSQEAFQLFLEQARGISARLGRKRRLLDAYLVCLLRLAGAQQAAELAEQGEREMRRLRAARGELEALRAAHDRLREAAEQMRTDLDEEARRGREWTVRQRLYERMCGLLGGETMLERLDELFHEAFLPLDPKQFFVRGFLEEVMISLASPGTDGGPPLLSVLLDDR